MCAAVVLAVGCGASDPPPPFTIQLALDTSDTHWCSSTECSDFGMACGALVSVRIVDPETRELFSEHCELVPASETLCGLNAISFDIPDIPVQMVSIEVAMWDPSSLSGDPPECPEIAFDLNGVPVPAAEDSPAFAGAAYFPVGEKEIALVSLACPEPEQLDSLDCQPAQTTVSANVDDLEAGLFVDQSKAVDLGVAVGEPRLITIDPPNNITVAELKPGETHPLTLSEGLPISLWTGDITASFSMRACVVVLDESEPQATRAITCAAVSSGASELSLGGLLVPKDTLTKILDALGLTAFPSQGLVIGRVVDHLGAPVGGVALTIGTGDVKYLNEDRSGFDGPMLTASHGYFVSTNAPYDTRWQAQHLDGRTEDGEYRAGLIDGALSAVEIQLQAP